MDECAEFADLLLREWRSVIVLSARPVLNPLPHLVGDDHESERARQGWTSATLTQRPRVVDVARRVAFGWVRSVSVTALSRVRDTRCRISGTGAP